MHHRERRCGSNHSVRGCKCSDPLGPHHALKWLASSSQHPAGQESLLVRLQNAQVHEMVSASLSHPSILMHGFFNEGPSQNQLACAAYAASADAIRQVAPSSHRLVTWATSAKEHVCAASCHPKLMTPTPHIDLRSPPHRLPYCPCLSTPTWRRQIFSPNLSRCSAARSPCAVLW